MSSRVECPVQKRKGKEERVVRRKGRGDNEEEEMKMRYEKRKRREDALRGSDRKGEMQCEKK